MNNAVDFNSLDLSMQQRYALFNIKKNLKDKYPVSELIVFGSVARHAASFESDLERILGDVACISFDSHIDISESSQIRKCFFRKSDNTDFCALL